MPLEPSLPPKASKVHTCEAKHAKLTRYCSIVTTICEGIPRVLVATVSSGVVDFCEEEKREAVERYLVR